MTIVVCVKRPVMFRVARMVTKVCIRSHAVFQVVTFIVCVRSLILLLLMHFCSNSFSLSSFYLFFVHITRISHPFVGQTSNFCKRI